EDPDSSGAPRSGRSELMGLLSVLVPAGPGETTGMQWTAPADFERGTLVFRVVSHDAQKNVFVSTARLVVAGSDLYDKYPAELLRMGSKPGRGKAEVVVMPADSAHRPAPGVLYVPPTGMSARATMRMAASLVARGQTVALVSLPGAGRTTGRPDRAGPASVAAVEAALKRLARETSVDTSQLAVWGVGDGGTAVLLAAVHHPELKAVIAQDASYDAWATYRALPADARAAFVREAGSDSAG